MVGKDLLEDRVGDSDSLLRLNDSSSRNFARNCAYDLLLATLIGGDGSQDLVSVEQLLVSTVEPSRIADEVPRAEYLTVVQRTR